MNTLYTSDLLYQGLHRDWHADCLAIELDLRYSRTDTDEGISSNDGDDRDTFQEFSRPCRNKVYITQAT